MFKNTIKIALLCLVIMAGSIIVAAQQTKTLQSESAQLQAKQEAERIATQRIDEFRSLYIGKFTEYKELKVLLPQETELVNVFLGLREAADESKLKVLRFAPRKDSQQGFIKSKSVEVEVTCNFNNLRVFFDEMAKYPRILSITDFGLSQLEKQTTEATLQARFLISVYYSTDNSLEKKMPAVSSLIEEQKELETRIVNLDTAIEAIKQHRLSQAAPSAVLEVIVERIAMTPGIYLQSIEQTSDQLTVTGNAPDESAVKKFGRSLEFSGGLFSNLNIETQKIENKNAGIVKFTIRCFYTPSKANVSLNIH